MEDSPQLFVITDDEGTILGAGLPSALDEAGVSAGFGTLPGQTLHQVDIPAELARLNSAEEILRGVFKYHIPRGSSRMEPCLPTTTSYDGDRERH